MFQIMFNHGRTTVKAVGSGYREAIYTDLELQDDGSYAGSMLYMRPAEGPGYEGASKPVRLEASIIEEARQKAVEAGATNKRGAPHAIVRWNGEKYFVSQR